ncbi:MAG: phosphodiester glycosidase family protein [Halanaerobiales bacterium]
MEEFIRDGKEINLLLNEEMDNFYLKPEKELFLRRQEDDSFISLKAGERYSFSSGMAQDILYSIQIIATGNEERAAELKQDFIDQGYSKVHVIKEDGLYKLRLGPYLERENTETELNRLRKTGWNPWVVEYNQSLEESIQVFNESDELVFLAKSVVIDGKKIIEDRTYNGKSIFTLENGDITFKHRTTLSNILSGVMQNNFSDQKLSSGALELYAISLRTYFLSFLYNVNHTIYFPAYQGLSSRQDINSAVSSTEGLVLLDSDKNEQFYYINNLVLNRDDFLLETDNKIVNNFQELLDELYSGYILKDLKELNYQKNLVDAEIRWGLRYKEIQQLTWYGPRVITIVEADLNRRFIKVEPVLAQHKVRGLDDLARMALSSNALAAVNGGYFHYSGRPLGLLFNQGKLIAEPLRNRTALLLTEDNQAYFKQVNWQGALENEEENINVNGVNRIIEENEVIVYNNYYESSAPAIKAGIIELVIIDNIVKEINLVSGETNTRPMPTTISDNAYIVQAHGIARDFFDGIKIGDNLNFTNKFTPDFDKLNIVSAIGAGPLLLKDSQKAITAEEELFQADISTGRAPRTAIGKTRDNRLVFFTVDGRNIDHSIGISLDELSDFMIDYGIVEGMNLDGGNSARMVVRGFTMNSPSAERLLSNGIIIGVQ